MQCNIDAQGKAFRLILGGFFVFGGMVLTALCLAGVLVSPAWWAAVAVSFAVGAFCLYEGWHGWCALRAMGIRTPW